MSNAFSKEERVAFEDILEGFNDALVMSKAVNVYGTDGSLMERANDTIWRPTPYIARSQNRTVGVATTARDNIQLSVPATLGYKKNDTWTLNALELRDALQEKRLGDASRQILATDINTAVSNVAALQGTLTVAVSGAAGQFDDVALCETIMNEQGVAGDDRFIAFNTRDYNGLAGDLAAVTRSFGNKKSDNAYDRAMIGDNVAGFTALKLDTGKRIAAAAGGATLISTLVGAVNYYTPRATSTAAGTGEVANVDNRYQTITVDNTGGVVAGDTFTIGGVNAIHHITKEDTGQPKTFRVISVASGTTLVISPPIISAQGSTAAELNNQNCIVTPSATAPFNWLNDNATGYNVFWRKPAIELLPGRYAVPTDAGVAIMRGTTDQGIEVVMGKKFDNTTFTSTYTLDVLFGVVMTNPEQCGILLFNQ